MGGLAMGVAVHSSDVLFLPAGQLPRTSSGKLQRRLIAKAYERARLGDATNGLLARRIRAASIG